jgi:hypothetical protein
MDATRIRALIDGALDAQAALEAAEAAVDAAKKAFDLAVEQHRKEVGNLQAALNSVGAVAYGDRLIRVGPAGGNRPTAQWVHVVPLVSVPAVVPLPAPLPEAATPVVMAKGITMEAKTAAPLSAGKVPEIKKGR